MSSIILLTIYQVLLLLFTFISTGYPASAKGCFPRGPAQHASQYMFPLNTTSYQLFRSLNISHMHTHIRTYTNTYTMCVCLSVLFFLWFPCVGVRLVYWSLRSTATFVIGFHWSLLLAFSRHFSSSSAFLRSIFTQSSHLSCGLPRFLKPSCLFVSDLFGNSSSSFSSNFF